MDIDVADELLIAGYKAENEERLWQKFLVEQPQGVNFEQYKNKHLPKKTRADIDTKVILEIAEKAEKFFNEWG